MDQSGEMTEQTKITEHTEEHQRVRRAFSVYFVISVCSVISLLTSTPLSRLRKDSQFHISLCDLVDRVDVGRRAEAADVVFAARFEDRLIRGDHRFFQP